MPHGLAGAVLHLAPNVWHERRVGLAAVTRCSRLNRSSSPCSHSRSSRRTGPTPECCRTHSQHIWAGTAPSSGRRRSSWLARGILDTYRQEQAAATKEAGADEPPCTVECVKDIHCVADLDRELEEAGDKTLVVVDFYKTACGSCRYIQPGFLKLCRASAEEHAPVKFLRHNIFDEYEELSDLSEKFKIRAVPLFYFFKGGQVLEKFATRERRRIAAAINQHAGYEVLHPG